MKQEVITLKDALFAHDLDVAALELEGPSRQYENLAKWVNRITVPEDQAQGRKLLAGFAKRYRLAAV